MTKDEIIRMAREAGWDDHHAQFDTRFQTFAALVASAERKEILDFANSEAFNRQHGERSPYAYELASAILTRGQA